MQKHKEEESYVNGMSILENKLGVKQVFFLSEEQLLL